MGEAKVYYKRKEDSWYIWEEELQAWRQEMSWENKQGPREAL